MKDTLRFYELFMVGFTVEFYDSMAAALTLHANTSSLGGKEKRLIS